MITGEQVLVRRREEVGRDPGNNPVFEWSDVVVDNVLVAPGPREDVEGGNRLEGVRVAWNLHFPKEFTESLRGAQISVRGGPFSPVIGDPGSYMEENTPGDWNRPVEVERVDG
jgi:hypothetical protein